MTQPTRNELGRALARMGDDPAAYLRGRGIRGTRSKYDCPIARHVRAELGLGADQVRVSSGDVHAGDWTIPGESYAFLPEPVEDFRSRWDRGEFPDMVETGATR